LKHYLANERDAAHALKRGGGLDPVPLEAVPEPRNNLTPDKAFERHWAIQLVNRALARLRDECRLSGRSAEFERLKPYLTGDEDRVPYRAAAAELGMSEGAVKVAVHRFRLRFHEALRAEVAQTVAAPEEVGDEIRYLLSVIRS
jgi:RNA polymerase sigma-70 factor (ECF subfamily)